MVETNTRVLENVPSPFCGIASDDLTIQVSGNTLKVLENGDSITVAGFEQPLTDTQPRVAGKDVTLQEAVSAVAGLLKAARLPVFSGFGTDVNDTRAALSLADRSGAVLDQARSEGGLRNLLVLADSGWFATTLGELKNRVEVLVVFGSDIESDFPRFYERFIWPQETLFGQDAGKREIIYIGRAPSGEASTAPDGRKPVVLPCALEDLPAVAAAFNALTHGARLQATHVGGIAVADLAAVLERVKQAHYSVFTWAAGHLAYAHADLTVQQLSAAVVALNAGGLTRSAILPLGGQDGDRTASQVFAWQSGYPTRISYARGYPEYDPYHFSVARLLQSGEADVLIWISTLNARLAPPATHIPTVVIGRSGMRFEREPDVYIPVSTPGIDHAGHMYRCDNVVCLPLHKLRDSNLPTGSAVLAAIEKALEE
ncbi:formylmethanofuran dehydrogenase subunit B [Candidatus Methylospira mobilis]|uniref:Formylmethanofuran dehydrogenase subunit B n=1 Tax=Candidatus Methylospira mobilis TaxID=1808979 RepID=A0A5Q0BD24_9GAMM|nr:formylmethanofuran dehydrogenase subunit B [Candidatus Methylospira mobilis]QFY41765.1 formylmethanofuran dehydrogenase subunit B [Candidatus Methylospira mobilis]WNV06626.1 formylmethanofuran dehydrogenase subunit B [Candidatus Methylospira mobilis]